MTVSLLWGPLYARRQFMVGQELVRHQQLALRLALLKIFVMPRIFVNMVSLNTKYLKLDAK